MNKPLLTIAIPTYKRAALLHTCLEHIVMQLSPEQIGSDVELLISDNASPDDTASVVQSFIDKGYPINYSRNEENVGPDRNSAKCFLNASGKYVCIFSDDDFILPGYLNLIIELLKSNEFGCVFLNSLWYTGVFDYAPRYPEQLDYQVFEQPLQFIDKIHYWITFISGNIINKSVLKDTTLVPDFYDTNLVQLSWILPAIFSDLKNVYVNNQAIACKGSNSGGYGIFDVFGTKFNKVLDQLVNRQLIDKAVKRVINNNLLQSYFPQVLFQINKDYKKENPVATLLPVYWQNKLYWKHIFWPVARRKYLTLSPLKVFVARAVYAVNNSGYYRLVTNQNREKEVAAFNFKFIGGNSYLPELSGVTNGKYISIGDNFRSQNNLTLEALDEYEGNKFTPEIVIGHNVTMNAGVHISCINKVSIGNNVILSNHIYICDYSRGDGHADTLAMPVVRRPLVSAGPVIIEDNVLIGQGACILDGVTLGKNCVVAPNAVVTQSFPANSVIGGAPAQLIKGA